ncbi:MAG: S8 family peptidase [Halanaerobiaceae bacterium]
MVKKIILISVILLISTFIFLFPQSEQQSSDIYIFVIDSWHLEQGQENKILNNNLISHGESILRAIQGEITGLDIEIFKLNVAEGGRISQYLYYNSLRKIIASKKSNPDTRILVNISLSFYDYDNYHHQLIKILHDMGVGVIAAAGNDDSTKPIYPAAFAETLAVASADRRGKADYSNYGEYIDIAANGNFSFSFFNYHFANIIFNNYSSSGTSLAAPRVAGLLARVLAHEKNLSIKDGIEIIKENSLAINDSYFKDGLLGAGLINKQKTLISLDPYYYLKSTEVLMLVIILLTIIIIIFSKHKLITLFLILLVALVIIPFLIFIRELLFLHRNYNYILLFLIFLFLSLFIPLINSFQKKYKLKRYLKENSNPDIEYLLSLVIIEKKVYNIVESYFEKNACYHIEEMIDLFLKADLDKKRVLAGLFMDIQDENLIMLLIKIFSNQKKDLSYNDKLVILEIFEKTAFKLESLQEICREILFDYQEDSWLRYQALRTLFYTCRDKESILPILENLIGDRDELLRLEANGLLEEVCK